jgi:hypothetical protein
MVGLVPHRPLLTFPSICIEDFKGIKPSRQDGEIVEFDLTGFSASFKGQSGMSTVIEDFNTRSGHIPDKVDARKLDFNLLPDTPTFMQGLKLPDNWRDSPELLASFTYLPGRIGGFPDHSTNVVTSRWGFCEEEFRKKRRKTNITIHASDGLPTRVIELRRAGSAQSTVVACIVVKPVSGLVWALLTNGWVDENKNYDRNANGLLVNLSHVQAMMTFCKDIVDESVKVDFGWKSEPAVATNFGTFFRDVIKPHAAPGPLVKSMEEVLILYNSDVSCSGRRMPRKP